MRILYISERQDGGTKRHVRCLRQTLPSSIETYTIGEDEPFAGKTGHDPAEWKQIRRVIKTFRPDVIHFHSLAFFMCLYVKLFTRIPCFISLHLPSHHPPALKLRFLHFLMRRAYYLPVSTTTWNDFQRWFPRRNGEVLPNALAIHATPPQQPRPLHTPPIIGMVGRFIHWKDWPAFIELSTRLKATHPELQIWGIGPTPQQAATLSPEAHLITWHGPQPDGAAWTAKLDLFILTSTSEELPTTVLEAFHAHTPICGYLPRGGINDILTHSNGALKEVFIPERDPIQLAAIVQRLLTDATLRQRVIDDGWHILTHHFNAHHTTQRLHHLYQHPPR